MMEHQIHWIIRILQERFQRYGVVYQEGAYAIYGNELSSGSNATNYGFLYNWYAAKGITTPGSTTYKNLCPTGYHVPTDSITIKQGLLK